MKHRILLALLITALFSAANSFIKPLSAQPITVDFSYSGECVGSPTLFTATVPDPSIITSWVWNMGDGTFESGQSISHTFAGATIYQVILTVTDINGNTGIFTRNVQIYGLPTPLFSYETPNCQADSVHFTDLSSAPLDYITTWIWDYGDGSPNDTIHFPDDPNADHIFPNPTTYNVTLTVINSRNCINSITIPVTVMSSPIANFHYSQTGLCEDQVIQFTDASSAVGSGNNVAWSWDFGDPMSGNNNSSNLENPIHTYNTQGTYTVVMTVTNFNNCSDTMTKQIVIHDHPAAEFTWTSACLNDLVYFNPDTNAMNAGAISTWWWDFGDGGTSPSKNTAHSYIAPGDYTVSLTVTDTLGCDSTISHLITIHPLPTAHFDPGSNNCSGATVNFTNLSSTSWSYIWRWIWNYGDGTIDTVDLSGNPNVQHVYALPGNFLVTLTIYTADSCSNFETQTITIYPNPLANFDYDHNHACEGYPLQFTDLSQSNGGGSILGWNWDFGDPLSGTANYSTIQSPAHNFSGPGTYPVTLIVETSNGCSDTTSINVTVNAKPAVAFTSQNNCLSNQVLFMADTNIVNTDAITNYAWDFNDGSPVFNTASPNTAHLYSTSGTYYVTLTVTDTNGCTNFVTNPVVINPAPVSNFTWDQPACKDSEIQFTSLANLGGAPGYIVQWVWNFGDGNTTTINHPGNPNISHTYTTFGNFNVTLTIKTTDSCTATASRLVTVSANPLANFSYDAIHCQGEEIQFNDLSQPGSGGLQSWLWNFGDPGSGTANTSSLSSPTHTYNAAGTYTVTLEVANTGGCTDTITKTIVINPHPTVDFSIEPGCVNDSTHFISTTYVNAAATNSWFWNFGDTYTSVEEDPYHIYSASGSYQVTLTITDTAGCENTITHTAIVSLPPEASFLVSQQTCANLPVSFDNTSTTSSGTIATWYWEFGDGSDTLITAPANPDITHVYSTAGTYTVTLTVNTSLGCEDETSKTVIVKTSPLAAFAYENTCAGVAVNFTSQSATSGGSAIIGYLWNFGDPTSGVNNTSILQNPLHIFNSAGTYTVSLQVTNADGCYDTVTQAVIINPSPALEYNWSNTCAGTATQFTVDETITMVAAVNSWDWDFGDGSAHSNEQNPLHTYAQYGNYNVVLTIVDSAGCSNTKTHAVTINAQPVALFSFSSGCINSATQFSDESYTLNGEPIAVWHWDFGETAVANDTSNLQNPQWTYTVQGVYTVTLTVTTAAGCQDSTSTTIQVFPNPTANFIYTPAPCENGAVYFQDSSYASQASIVSWLWEFGPGSYSQLQNPVYVFYGSDSTYSVQLIVTDNRGCKDTIVKSVYVPAAFDFTFNYTPTCIGDYMEFSPELIAPLTDSLVFFNWNFGDPGSGIYNNSALRNPTHLYSEVGVYTVSLEAIDINNCNNTVFIPVSVEPLPLPDFEFTVGLCDTTAVFNDLSTGNGSDISEWIWTYGDGLSDTIYAPGNPDVTHKYLVPSLYTVELTVINANNCHNVFSQEVLVRPCLEAVFSEEDSLVCQNYNLSFADSSYCGQPITEWYWDFGDGTTTTYNSYTSPVNHIYTEAGNYSVLLRVTTAVSGQSISDSSIVDLIVSPSPVAEYSIGKVCYGTTAEFTNETVNNGVIVSGYQWDFDDPASTEDTSTLRNPSWLFGAPGYYDVRLISSNTLGCSDTVVKTIPVYMLPEANYDYSLSCAGNRTLFFDHSDSAYAPLSSWTWIFREGTELLDMKLEQNPEYVFQNSGEHQVSLIVQDTNTCTDTVTQLVNTYPPPVSDFTYNANYENVQGQLQFDNISVGATHYYWDFGNGETSYAEEPFVLYNLDGEYPITMIAYSDMECSDTARYVYNFMVKGLFIPNAFSPENPHAEVQLFKPVGINLKEYLIQVYDRFGNLLWYSDKLDDQGRPAEGWDGRYNGLLLQQGVYMWKAEAVFRDGVIWNSHDVGSYEGMKNSTHGTVTLIR